MPSDASLRLICDRVLAACETDAALREAVKDLAERALRVVARCEMETSPGGAGPIASRYTDLAMSPNGERTASALHRLPPDQIDLELVRRRLRLKADGARWAAERRRRAKDPDGDFEFDIEPGDRDIIRRAKEIPGCYLWTNGPNSPEPVDLERFEILAACYDNAAAAVDLVLGADAAATAWASPAMICAFRLLAEAQSALRAAAIDCGGPEDGDQFLIFMWLKANTRNREIYVERHMRIGDPAAPSNWHDLAARIGRYTEPARVT